MIDILLPYPLPIYDTPEAAAEAMRACSGQFITQATAVYQNELKSYSDSLQVWEERESLSW